MQVESSVESQGAILAESDALTSRCRSLSQRVATYIQRVTGEGDALADEVKMLLSDLNKACKKAEHPEVQQKLKHARAILKGQGPGGDLTKLQKQKVPFLLKYLLGDCVNVVTLQRKEQHALKEEYHGFRDKGAYLLIAASAMLLLGLWRAQEVSKSGAPGNYTLTPPFMVGVQFFLGWLLYFYTAMALRENVLRLNGSSIRQWWIQHHYCSMVTTLIILTLPVDSPAVQTFVFRLLSWSVAQGVVMVFQNHYQRRRMYTRIALGKNRMMDVVGGEASGGSGTLLILYPAVFVLQITQVIIGVQMLHNTVLAFLNPEGWLEMEAHESDLRGSRGVAVAGAMMVVMGLTNCYQTVLTLREKSKRRLRNAQANARYPPTGRTGASSGPSNRTPVQTPVDSPASVPTPRPTEAPPRASEPTPPADAEESSLLTSPAVNASSHEGQQGSPADKHDESTQAEAPVEAVKKEGAVNLMDS
eukprot:jgi/Botrbrau1/23333/Bobra.0102s0067.1